MVNTGARLMKYTLIAEDTWDGSKTTREFEVDALPQVLTEIELFLRGAGFFFDGNLDFVNDFEQPEWHTEEWDTPQDFSCDGHDGMGSTMADYPELYDEQDLPQGKSKHYFDTERNK
jgi:hypothetical protein